VDTRRGACAACVEKVGERFVETFRRKYLCLSCVTAWEIFLFFVDTEGGVRVRRVYKRLGIVALTLCGENTFVLRENERVGPHC